MTRNGKIARLPRDIREELNWRLSDGEPGPQIVTWLNGLPEVQEMLKRSFGGRPVSEQNLSDWRQGGYQDWVSYRELHQALTELDGENENLHDDVSHRLASDLWDMLGARVALLIRNWRPTGDAEANERGLKKLLDLVAALRRSHGEAEEAHLESQRFDVERKKVELEERMEPYRRQHAHDLHMAFLAARKPNAAANAGALPASNEKSGTIPVQTNQAKSNQMMRNRTAYAPNS